MWPCYLGNKAVSLWWMFPFDGLWLWAVFTAYTALNMRWFLKSIEWKDPQPGWNAPFMLRAPAISESDRVLLHRQRGRIFQSGPSFQLKCASFVMQQTCFYCRFIMGVLVQIQVQVGFCADAAQGPHTLPSTKVCVYLETRSDLMQEKHAV